MEERSVGFLLRDYLFNVIYINMCLVYQHRCFINKIILKKHINIKQSSACFI